MSEIDHQGNDFLWENQACWPFSSSDNSAGDGQPDDLKFAEAKKGLDLSSNSPTPTPTPTPTPRTVVPSSTVSSKRGRNHGSKSGGLKGEKKDDKEGCGGGGGSGGGESDHEIHIWTERERRKKMRNMFSNLHALLPQLPPKADKSTIVDEAVNYIKTLQHTLQKLQKQKLEMLRGAATTTTTAMQYEPSTLAGLQTAPLTINTTISTTTSTSRESFMADRVSSRDHSTVITATNMNTTLMTSSASPSIPPAVVPSPACLRSWSSPNVVLNVSGNDAQINICAPKKPGLLDAVLFVLEKHQIEVVTAHISSDYYRSMYMIHAHANRTWDQFQGALLVEEVYKLAVDEILCWISSCS